MNIEETYLLNKLKHYRYLNKKTYKNNKNISFFQFIRFYYSVTIKIQKIPLFKQNLIFCTNSNIFSNNKNTKNQFQYFALFLDLCYSFTSKGGEE